METMKKHLPLSDPEELRKIAKMFEEEVYIAGTNQANYLRKIYTKMMTMETKSQTTEFIDSMAQTGHNAVDWREECYQKIKSMKELYLSDLNAMYQKISIICQQHDSVLNVPMTEKIERLKLFKNMVGCKMQFLNVSKSNIVLALKDNIPAFEEQIIGILNLGRPRQPVSAQQEIQQPGGHPLSMQPQQPQEQQQQQPDNQMNHQMQPTNMQNSVSSSNQSTAVTSTHHGAMPLLSNHMELSSAQTIQSISNTNMFQLQFLERKKQQLEQQFRECQMYQQWINQQMQHVLQQQQQILQEQQQQIPQLQQQFQQLALQQQSVQLQAANQMLSPLEISQQHSSSSPQIHDHQQQQQQ